MNFEETGIYHIYNQGNNRQKIFFKRENYLYFLRKIRSHVLPYAVVLAWCLMPNHFHLMVYVHDSELLLKGSVEGVSKTNCPSHIQNMNNIKKTSFNHSIGIMLASYTRAINKQEKNTGSLFRKETKSICLNAMKNNPPGWYISSGTTYFHLDIKEWQYPQVCFNYIHNNPVNAKLTKNPEDWEFSSYMDITGKRNGTLVSRERIRELGLVI
jgi:putative transposase